MHAILFKGFIEASKLKIHMIVHSGDKPFECDTFKKRFPRKFALIEHKRIHTGEKPFECKICKKTFTKHSGLYNHERKTLCMQNL